MTITNNKHTYTIIGIVFLIGICLGLLIKNVPYLSLKTEISLGELTNFILTLFVAIYVPFFLSKSINNKRIEKDLVILDCSRLETELYKLRDLVESIYVKHSEMKKEDADRIILRTRQLSNLVVLLCECADKYKSIEKIGSICESLLTSCSNYWQDLTFNLRDSQPKITDENYLLTEKRIAEIASKIAKLKLLINEA